MPMLIVVAVNFLRLIYVLAHARHALMLLALGLHVHFIILLIACDCTIAHLVCGDTTANFVFRFCPHIVLMPGVRAFVFISDINISPCDNNNNDFNVASA